VQCHTMHSKCWKVAGELLQLMDIAVSRRDSKSLRIFPQKDDLQRVYEEISQSLFQKRSAAITRADWRDCEDGRRCEQMLVLKNRILQMEYVVRYESGEFEPYHGQWLCLTRIDDANSISYHRCCEDAVAAGRQGKVYPPTHLVHRVGDAVELISGKELPGSDEL
jgi:hypothetical protein